MFAAHPLHLGSRPSPTPPTPSQLPHPLWSMARPLLNRLRRRGLSMFPSASLGRGQALVRAFRMHPGIWDCPPRPASSARLSRWALRLCSAPPFRERAACRRVSQLGRKSPSWAATAGLGQLVRRYAEHRAPRTAMMVASAEGVVLDNPLESIEATSRACPRGRAWKAGGAPYSGSSDCERLEA